VPDTGDRQAIVVVVVEDGSEVVMGPVQARRPDLRLVEALARAQLIARRCGCRLVLRDVSADLRGLLELVGLADVLGDSSEARREAELREQLGVEEVVQPGDPPG
jgi:hypothetical protein